MKCPYCGGVQISSPIPIFTYGAEELLALGIQGPVICQCKECTATLSPAAFTEGSLAYQERWAARPRGD